MKKIIQYIYKRVILFQGLANIYRVSNNKNKQLRYLKLYLKESLKIKK